MNSINDRRDFLKHLSIASLGAFSIPMLGAGRVIPSIPTFTRVDDENYWEMVKKQFAVPDNLIMMNAANLCPAPYPVNERVLEYGRALAKDVSFQYREVFTRLRKKSIAMLSGFVGADPEEVGITRNTSEANCIVVQGLDINKGDEVIIWDQNHPSNQAVWLSRAKRYGFVVKTVSVPKAPSSIQELTDPFTKAITPKTRLLAFSHISNLSGIALPAKEICRLAHARGIMTLVDGAQALGFLDLDLRELGCTFYTSSTHKWLMGPFENGMLYVRKEYIPRIWPNIIGGGWKEGKTVDENICVLGQRNETTTAALPEILAFHESIGKKNIEARVVQLNTYLKAQIKAGIPTAEFVTPQAPELSGGIVIVNLPGKDPNEVTQVLYNKFSIASAPAGGIRLSPHIYNTKKDVDQVVKALVSIL
jgi:isopenicillin-N epimerase